ncbi:dehydrogenase/reductase SDR family member 11-like [Glandiceps talaboti]
MDRWMGCVALVTGASAGIGAAIARVLAEHGLKVYGCGRNVEAIRKLSDELKSTTAKGTLHPIKCDLRQEHEILAMFDEIKKSDGGVDVCINNAGLSHISSLLDGKTEDWREMLDVNILALCICTREAVKQMREKNTEEGHIIHISSMSGHRIEMGAFDTNFYTGTKHMIKGITEGLRQELWGSNPSIRVTAISPADVETRFNYSMYGEDIGRQLYAEKKCLEPTDISDLVVYVLKAPLHVQVHDILVRSIEQKS